MRSDSGRALRPGIRVVLRLLLFTAIWLAIAVPAAVLTPPVLPWLALPGLAGGLIAGSLVLGLEGRPLSTLGFGLSLKSGSGVALGLALGAAVALLTVGLIVALGGLRWTADAGGWGEWLAAGLGSLWLLAIPAAAEEAMLRGYPLLALSEVWGSKWAIGLTSVAFALLHTGNPEIGWIGFANIVAAGLFLGALRLRTGSLWWPTGAHLGWNWTHAFLADLPLSGLELVDAPLIESCAGGPAWLSGGAFGPEGSVLATGTVVAAAAWTWCTSRLGGRPRSSPGDARAGSTREET